MAVQLGASHRLPCRLRAFRVPARVAEQRRPRLRQKARKKGQKPSVRQWALCAWNLFLTTVPAALAGPAERSVLARRRWQIELLFQLCDAGGESPDEIVVDRSFDKNP